MSAEKDREFFIGWQGKAPPATGRYLRKSLLGFGIGAVALAALFAGMQQTIGRAWFEFGNVKEFQGILMQSPVPMLVTDEPDETSGESVFLLVNPFKFGYPAEKAEEFHLQPVTLRGTLIYNEDSGGAMIEVVETVAREGGDSGESGGGWDAGPGETVQLTGEIVDSKCWLGVMNPGSLKPHRACAINCIRGGIPPVLLVDRKEMVLLVGPGGEAINDDVLEHVALPVRMKGTLHDYGSLRVLHVDPGEIRQIGH